MTISPNKWELDVQGYLNVCNITAATPRKQIRDFSAGINDLGLWNSMVCWPLRSSQNYGSGTTAFSLGGLGTYNGALTNGPSWGADGVTTDGVNDYAQAQVPESSQSTVLAVMKRVDNADSEPRYYWGFIDSSQVDPLSGTTYYLKDGGLGIFMYNGSTVWSPGRQAVNASTNFGFQSVAYSESGPTSTSSLNGAFTNSTVAPNMSAVRQDTLIMGSQKGDAAFSQGVHAFYAYFVSSLANATVEQLRDLYKTTLGQGLTTLP